MKIILDTHIFLWSLAAPERLEDERRQIIESRTNTVFVSAITMAELSIKSSIGKLRLDFSNQPGGLPFTPRFRPG